METEFKKLLNSSFFLRDYLFDNTSILESKYFKTLLLLKRSYDNRRGGGHLSWELYY